MFSWEWRCAAEALRCANQKQRRGARLDMFAGSEMVRKEKWSKAIGRCSTDASSRLSARPRKGK